MSKKLLTSVGNSVIIPTLPITTDLVFHIGYESFDGSDILKDLSGNGNDFNIKGNLYAINNYLEKTSNDTLITCSKNFITTDNRRNFTLVSVFNNMTNTSSTKTFFSNYNTSGYTGCHFALGSISTTDDKETFSIQRFGGDSPSTSYTLYTLGDGSYGYPNDNNFHVVVITQNDSETKAYLDGLITNKTASKRISASTAYGTCLFARNGSEGSIEKCAMSMKCKFKCVLFYNRTLPEDEILALQNYFNETNS